MELTAKTTVITEVTRDVTRDVTLPALGPNLLPMSGSDICLLVWKANGSCRTESCRTCIFNREHGEENWNHLRAYLNK